MRTKRRHVYFSCFCSSDLLHDFFFLHFVVLTKRGCMLTNFPFLPFSPYFLSLLSSFIVFVIFWSLVLVVGFFFFCFRVFDRVGVVNLFITIKFIKHLFFFFAFQILVVLYFFESRFFSVLIFFIFFHFLK